MKTHLHNNAFCLTCSQLHLRSIFARDMCRPYFTDLHAQRLHQQQPWCARPVHVLRRRVNATSHTSRVVDPTSPLSEKGLASLSNLSFRVGPTASSCGMALARCMGSQAEISPISHHGHEPTIPAGPPCPAFVSRNFFNSHHRYIKLNQIKPN